MTLLKDRLLVSTHVLAIILTVLRKIYSTKQYTEEIIMIRLAENKACLIS